MIAWFCGRPPPFDSSPSTRSVAVALPSSALNWVCV
jgi:hypothetical protein